MSQGQVPFSPRGCKVQAYQVLGVVAHGAKVHPLLDKLIVVLYLLLGHRLEEGARLLVLHHLLDNLGLLLPLACG